MLCYRRSFASTLGLVRYRVSVARKTQAQACQCLRSHCARSVVFPCLISYICIKEQPSFKRRVYMTNWSQQMSGVCIWEGVLCLYAIHIGWTTFKVFCMNLCWKGCFYSCIPTFSIGKILPGLLLLVIHCIKKLTSPLLHANTIRTSMSLLIYLLNG